MYSLACSKMSSRRTQRGPSWVYSYLFLSAATCAQIRDLLLTSMLVLMLKYTPTLFRCNGRHLKSFSTRHDVAASKRHENRWAWQQQQDLGNGSGVRAAWAAVVQETGYALEHQAVAECRQEAGKDWKILMQRAGGLATSQSAKAVLLVDLGLR